MTTTDHKSPSPRMWEAAKKLARCLDEAISNEVSLIKARKKHENEMHEMGREEDTLQSDEWRKTASDLKLAETMIKEVRESKIYFADKLRECVLYAAAGTEYGAGVLEEIAKPKPAVSAPLFDRVIENAHLDEDVESEADGTGGSPVGEPDADARKRAPAAADDGETKTSPPTPRPQSRGEAPSELSKVKVEDVIDKAEFPLVIEELHKHNVFTLADAATRGKAFLVRNCGIGDDHAERIMLRVQQLRSVEPAAKGEAPAKSGKRTPAKSGKKTTKAKAKG